MSKTAYIVLGLACSLLISAPEARAQTDVEEVAEKLVDAGFANVRVLDEGNRKVFAIQNDRYKIQSQGIARALKIIKDCDNSDTLSYKVIATYYDIPQVTLTYEPGSEGWKSTYRLDDSWKQIRNVGKRNSSFGKVDVVVYPQFSFMNLIITQVYQSLFQISPAIEFSLWPGSKFTALVKIPVWNDGYSTTESYTHPYNLTFSQRFRDPWNLNVFGKLTMGIFTGNRHGVALELFYPFRDERFSLEAQFGALGLGYWNKFVYHFDDIEQFCWAIGPNFYWPRVQTTFSLKAQKWLMGEKGVKFEMIRHFRYCSIGFYAEKGFMSDAHTNGGFRFMVSLPPYGKKRHGYLPRVTTGSMGMTYNANNEQYFYKEFKTEASDNIMEHNGFNPLYIESEIVKLNY